MTVWKAAAACCVVAAAFGAEPAPALYPSGTPSMQTFNNTRQQMSNRAAVRASQRRARARAAARARARHHGAARPAKPIARKG